MNTTILSISGLLMAVFGAVIHDGSMIAGGLMLNTISIAIIFKPEDK